VGTVAIIGDVGGHANQLARCLTSLGVTPGVLPDELTVVQVGDLLGGVDDWDVVEMVHPCLASGRWVQLLGNWDSRVVGGCPFTSPSRGEPDADAEDRIALWHHAGFAHHAAAVTTNAGATAVITHAGVTAPFWRQALGATPDPFAAAARINALPLDVVHRPGRMLGFVEPPVEVDFGHDDDDRGQFVEQSRRTGAVGPIWADTDELWSGWLDAPSPWLQVHGHTSAWFRNDWSQHAPPDAVAYATRDTRLRHTRFVSGRGSGPPIIGVDCSVWAARDCVLHPLIIPNAHVAVPDPDTLD
jgi:hypothetical protein